MRHKKRNYPKLDDRYGPARLLGLAAVDQNANDDHGGYEGISTSKPEMRMHGNNVENKETYSLFSQVEVLRASRAS